MRIAASEEDDNTIEEILICCAQDMQLTFRCTGKCVSTCMCMFEQCACVCICVRACALLKHARACACLTSFLGVLLLQPKFSLSGL